MAGGLFSYNSKLIGLFGTGVDLLLPMKYVRNNLLIKVDDILGDLVYSGGKIAGENFEVLSKNNNTGKIILEIMKLKKSMKN